MGLYVEQNTQLYLDGQARAAQVPATPFDEDDSELGLIFKRLYLARRGSTGKNSSENGTSGSSPDVISVKHLAEISQQRAAASAAAEAERRRLLDWPEMRVLLGWTCAAEVVTTAETPVTPIEVAGTEPADREIVARYPYGVLLKGGL